MVLQQKTMASVWGTDKPNTSITITGSWDESATTKTDKAGKWKVKLKTPEAGGPYFLTIEGSNKVVLKNVLIGEVWICAGQSNMEMPLKGYNNQPVNGSNEAILNATNSNIRLFTIERNPSLVPAEDVSGKWLVSNPQNAKDFSAVGYFFGEKINSLLNVPVGLISIVWGASRVETWMDEETLSEFKEIEIPKEIPKEYPQHSPTLLYNGMIHPLQGYSTKGFIWYQGESNITKANQYVKLFPAMINQWRNQWQQGTLPFYYVQIAPFKYWGNTPVYLREAQLKCLPLIQKAGMVVTMDIGDCDFIHPPEKRVIGERLALWALAKDYNFEGIAYSGPLYKKFEITEDGKIDIYFDYCPLGLTSYGLPITGFEIAGEDKVFYPATATINENRTVTVFSEKVAKPLAVRYGFIPCPKGTLFNVEGLPASPFRTDEWKEEN
ncbi:MAG: sialate O-acetylesterase [Bacteroidales bacterium]|nr:sialate O-acetylesterase [Bacteroidales bacterium]